MIRDIFMPALSSTMTEGKIVSWVKSPGEKVSKGETVLVVESDKADMDVESFYDGYLAVILVEAGQEAPVGEAIAYIAETEEEIELAKAQGKTAASAPSKPVETPEIAPPPVSIPVAAVKDNGRLVASPRAKKLAKELKVDLKTLVGSGPHGRITAEDVEKATGKVSTAPAPVITPPQPVSVPVAAPKAPIPASAPVGRTVPLTTLQKAVAQNMSVSLQVPTFQVGYTITTDPLDQLYQQLKSKGVTMTALLAKAVANTLAKHPIVNASYSDAGIQYHGAINVSVAVAMPGGGLITPVLRSADQMDIYSLSRSWKDLVDRARSKQLQPEEYNSGTFTISNLGMFGVDRFTAILPPNQGAILAVGASRPQIVVNNDGLFGVQKQMTVNLTSDHRVIYGADAASFLQDLAKLIETEVQSLTM
ncbi:MAG: 2-oxo acid dehydrogenase subunit E2 [Microcystis sp. M114S2]|jgi:pyruvate dehydrogenase E2 component (dihydrolipoamide acetyltransferase)|uniref:dihydrolipoamide acetyltransferase family protein n=1 Tax=unclassified Microcystis TaxID=2643300 RepID=UPI002588A2A3|nr:MULTISPECIES: dihydrolipoamide acetyltransferase family protein [unclassified Microcystis]MCA2668236.1 2-oxo acid dehydrogenase subunit E2 [Microcystis sp. M045S2]MCA2715165.1 2-oxo acid dehydrogenase subunit E2 [Microcystis sp. M172S2]MCA2804033.1 2-oxo acid dehydrogenase subunit E2 [Microcystis sp. M114S2]MCA2832215.1 2-oxo acid dehydrogenase subunit E2 [Microcystis sp. M007S1]MCA2840379.1 2-oxo acid dehydrogenase subunit E2 [Microcystis sp. M078S1]